MLIFTTDNNVKIIYIHIPRCCGKYIRKEIYKKFNTYFIQPGADLDVNIIPVSSKDEISCEYMLHNRYINYVKYNLEQTKFITFVRNPYDRIISAYYYYSLGNYYNPYLKNDLLDFIVTPINNLKNKTINHLIAILKKNFKNYIKTEVENLNENFNYVLCPQYKFVVDENNKIPEDISIYKLEEYTPESEAGKFFNFENFNLKVYDHSEYFDNETLEIVNRKYSMDFELFVYKKLEYIN